MPLELNTYCANRQSRFPSPFLAVHFLKFFLRKIKFRPENQITREDTRAWKIVNCLCGNCQNGYNYRLLKFKNARRNCFTTLYSAVTVFTREQNQLATWY